MQRNHFLTPLLLTALLGAGCAGPHTPFGAMGFKQLLKHDHESLLLKEASISHPAIKITSTPSRQLHHTSFELVIRIQDQKEILENFQYEVLYNSKKIDPWWKTELIRYPNPKNKKVVEVRFKDLSLPAHLEHEIQFVFYRHDASALASFKLKKPECPIDSYMPVKNLSPFPADKQLQGRIDQVAKELDLNPSLLAGLIAQESSFDSKAISWAKAVGLTQVTPIANKEIVSQRPLWPVDPRLEHANYLSAKRLILQNKISAKNDWRLNPKLSIEGGAVFLNRLRSYWLASDQADKDILTELILASYNSGAYRVKKAYRLSAQDWKNHPELKEAKSYLSKVKSYCHTFAADALITSR